MMLPETEHAVALFLGEPPVDWEMLRPITAFVVLWNRLEMDHGGHLNYRNLFQSAEKVANRVGFDVSVFEPEITFLRHRYRSEPNRLPFLFRTSGEQKYREQLMALLEGETLLDSETVSALMIVPYRIRNNLFHGRKAARDFYQQMDYVRVVNDILCKLHQELLQVRTGV